MIGTYTPDHAAHVVTRLDHLTRDLKKTGDIDASIACAVEAMRIWPATVHADDDDALATIFSEAGEEH
jgi:hypothetical protein